jgi:hypothetical protein
MAVNTRSHGANARQIDWDQDEQAQRGRTGTWLPLDALSDEQLYAGTPQLQAIPAAPPRRSPFGPSRRQEEIAPTRPQPVAVPTPRVKRREKPAASSQQMVQAKAVALLAGLGLAALSAYVGVSAAVEWTEVKLDDLQYGRPRTMQMDAYVGHSEAEGVPSHFVAMNLNRRVTILEMPGGDSTKVSTIVGPYLFGQGEDLTPVTMGSQDLNADGRSDLIVSVKNEQLLYLNDGTTFKLATAEERAAIEKALKTAPAPAAPPAGDGTGAARAGNGEVSR